MSEIANAYVRVRPQMSGFKSETESTFKSTFGSLTKIVAGAAAVIGGTKILGSMIQEFSDSTKIAAQTNAVLQSTGSIANVSAGQVQQLATALMNKSGVDDEAIKSGENMLLTFTSIRNEAGKGNDIFNQTSKAVLDMDTAMTHGNVTAESLAHTSILVGKALNDPVKGATALRRVGVSLDEQQQKMIKTMVAHNDVIGAQKIVLGELNKEFGGSAAAMGSTLPGKINILRENLKNLGGDLIGKLAPAFNTAVTFAIDHLPQISAVMSQVGAGISYVIQNTIVPVVQRIADVVQTVVAAVKPHWQEIKDDVVAVADGFKAVVGAIVDFGGKYQGVLLPLAGFITAIVVAIKAWEVATAAWTVVTTIATAVQTAFDAVLAANPIGLVVLAIAGLVGALVVLYTRSQTVRDIVNGAFQAIRQVVSEVVGFLSNLWKKYGDDLIAVARTAFNTVKTVIQTVISVIRALWAEFGGALISIARTYFDALKTYISTVLNVIKDVIRIALALIHGDWGKAWSALKDLVSTVISGVIKIISDFASIALTLAKAIGKALLDGILAGLSALGSLVMSALRALGGVITGIAGDVYGWAVAIGKSLVSGVMDGLGNLASAAADKVRSGLNFLKHPHLWSTPQELTRDGLGKPLADGVIEGYLLGIGTLPAKVKDTVKAAIDAAKQQVSTQQGTLQTAFQQLAGYGIRAFEAATTAGLNKMQTAFNARVKKLVTDPMNAAMAALDKANASILSKIDAQQNALTPTEKLLRDIQTGHDEQQRQQAITDAQSGLTAAQSGGDPAAILQAQQQLADAQYAETVAQLQVRADAERAAADATAQSARDAETTLYNQKQAAIQARYDAVQAGLQKEYDTQVLNYQSERDLQEQHLNTILTNLQASLSTHPGEWTKIHDQIMKMFKTSFGPDYKTAGKNLGTGFAKGIRESFGEVGSAVAELSALVAKFLKVKSPTELGPMSDLDTWWKALPETLVGSLGKGAIAAALTGALALGNGGLSLPGVGTGGGVPQLTGALSPLGNLAVSNLAILDELKRQTAIAENGKNVEVTVGGGSGEGQSVNDAARQAIR